MITVYGDSISVGLVYNEEKSKYELCRTACLRLLSAAGFQIQNCSAIGSTIDMGLKRLRENKPFPGGLCVVQFGGNDCDLDWAAISENPDECYDGKIHKAEFESYLETFLLAVRNKEMLPCLVIPPPVVSELYFHWVSKDKKADNILRFLGDVEQIFRWHDSYSDIIAAFAEKKHCPVVDFRRCFLAYHNDKSYFSQDGIHPNKKGHQLMADYVIEKIHHASSKIIKAISISG